MKRILIILFSLFMAPVIQAQTGHGFSDVKITKLQEEGDSLKIELEIKIRNINKFQTVKIAPRLYANDSADSLILPYVQVNGNVKWQKFERGARFGQDLFSEGTPYMLLNARNGIDNVIKYHAAVAFKEWMTDATVFIGHTVIACAERTAHYNVWFPDGIKLEERTSYIPDIKVAFITPAPMQKTRMLKGEAFLDFKVNSSEIIPNFRRNPQELQKINGTFSSVVGDPDVEIESIFIEGYASPDGRWDVNDRLSRNRAESLKKYLINGFGIPEYKFTVTNTAEDWDGLIEMINASDIIYKDQILEIIYSTDIFDGRESKLMRLAGGNPYRIMLNDMFPLLRRVEYQIDYKVKDYSVNESLDILERKPELLSEHEFHTLAIRNGENDPEFEKIIRLALRYYPDNLATVNNAAAVMISKGDLRTARDMLLVLETEDAVILNNIGASYLSENNLIAAETFLTKAAAAGSYEAEHNLKQLEIMKEDNLRMEKFRNRTK